MLNKGDLWECEQMAIVCKPLKNIASLQVECDVMIDGKRRKVRGDRFGLKEIMQAEDDYAFIAPEDEPKNTGKIVLWVPEMALSLKLTMTVPTFNEYSTVTSEYNVIDIVAMRREYLRLDPDDFAFATLTLSEKGEQLLEMYKHGM